MSDRDDFRLQKRIAWEYGVSQAAISLLVRGKTWIQA